MRTETDRLGTRQIDDSQYYGIQTQRAIENFSISRKTIADIPEFVFDYPHQKSRRYGQSAIGAA